METVVAHSTAGVNVTRAIGHEDDAVGTERGSGVGAVERSPGEPLALERVEARLAEAVEEGSGRWDTGARRDVGARPPPCQQDHEPLARLHRPDTDPRRRSVAARCIWKRDPGPRALGRVDDRGCRLATRSA